MVRTVAVIGAGNGGKALAADLTLQGCRVRLFEFPEYRSGIDPLLADRRLTATGDIEGTVTLDKVTLSLDEAIAGADTIMVCTQAAAHERSAQALAPMIRPDQRVVVCPGSTGGSLRFARVFRKAGMRQLPLLAETSTLPYGCRGSGTTVQVYLKVRRVLYGVLPAKAAGEIGPGLEALFPGFVRGMSVLHAGLCNANPIIHPPIALLNAARIEKQGPAMLFYKDGVSPVVAKMIAALDTERMALLRALGYTAQSDPLTCVQQGYAESDDYYQCYGTGKIFSTFTSPDTVNHRYFHEDIGNGLVLFCALGKVLNVPTPASEAFVRIGSVLQGVDYAANEPRALASLGIAGKSLPQLKRFLETGE